MSDYSKRHVLKSIPTGKYTQLSFYIIQLSTYIHVPPTPTEIERVVICKKNSAFQAAQQGSMLHKCVI